MKIEFAPLQTPLARRLQMAVMLHWLFAFLVLAPLCVGLIIILIIYNYWFLYVPILTWLYIDRRTPEQGGRRSNWIRSWTMWRYFKDYFPIHLIKTWDLDPSHNYIFGFHPHGVLVAGAFGNFCTECSDFKELFPGLTAYLHVLPILLWFPLYRESLLTVFLLSLSKPLCLDSFLALHMLFGYLLLPALGCRAYLVPVFSFGENDIYKQVSNPEGSWLRAVQDRLQKIMGFALPLFHARGIFQYSFGFVPYRKPIYSVVGRPIPVRQTPHPSLQQITELHQTYLEALRELFEEHKGKYGIPEHTKLVFK
ncbi:PREDICTED: 2-acylglycerol O-acyltransferase 1 [Condylura cristata]|uniref:2-acylglycerol O-acyltransferase 1 n=1 Tax=Condylura cristata TaxID=143302 RepID=UPI00033436D6|nr:PREDICTED: 2-acylglycerol O-acyltransferase 1 [Condylura cristata]